MAKRVKVLVAAEVDVRDEPVANAVLLHIPGEIAITIQESKSGHEVTGVIPGSVRVDITEKTVT